MNKNYDYKRLTPFKWFVLQNFPFIDEDFDAITNYQLFCKLGEEINKIIDSQNILGEQAENLTNAFNNLKNYVDNYFDNLDVQDEINNKLNEMAKNGTLSSLIGKYINNDINPIINEQNLKINSIDSKVNSIANGSPAGIYNTIEDLIEDNPNHSKIYLVLSNGHWYYFDTTWKDGGVYQSSQIGQNEVALNNLENNLQNMITPNFHIINNDLNFINDYYMKNDGNIVPGASAGLTVGTISYCEINVSHGDLFKIEGIDFGNAPLYLIKDNNDNILEISNIGSTRKTIIVPIPKNGTKIYINSVPGRNQIPIIQKAIDYVLSETSENNIIKPIPKTVYFRNPKHPTSSQHAMWCTFKWSVDNLSMNENDNIILSFNIYLKNFQEFSGFQLFYDDHEAGTGWKLFSQLTPFTKNGNYSINFKVFSNLLSVKRLLICPLFKIDNSSLDGFMWNIKMYNTTQKKLYNNIENNLISENDIFLKEFSKIDYLNNYETPYLPTNLLSLENKNLVFFGDSVVNGQGATPYSSRLKSLLNLNISEKQGYSGSTITRQDGRICLIDKIQEFDFKNFDYCLIQIGTNDLTSNAELGILYNYNTSYDDSKFYESYKKAINYILTNNPNIKIVLLTPLQRFNYNNFNPITKNTVDLTLMDYVNAVKNIGEFYSLPVIDMFSNSGINYNTFNIYTSDGLHPNDLGYERITNYLANQLLLT